MHDVAKTAVKLLAMCILLAMCMSLFTFSLRQQEAQARTTFSSSIDFKGGTIELVSQSGTATVIYRIQEITEENTEYIEFIDGEGIGRRIYIRAGMLNIIMRNK